MPVQLDDETWLRLAQTAYEQNLVAVLLKLNKPISPILLKGWSVSRFYDEGHSRLTTDLDILVSSAEQLIALKEIPALSNRIAIDAHLGPRHLDKLGFEELFERSYEVELNGVPVRVLADEDNLRITAVHWLLDGGVNKEKLWDIYYLVKNRKADFDWARCLESNGPIRKTWVVAAVATARDHLGLEVADLPEEIKEFKLPRWYEQTLEREWRLGPYPRYILSTVLFRPKLLIEQLRRKLPPNRIAATIDAEAPIDAASRIPVQMRSLTKKLLPFARGLRKRLVYSIRGSNNE